jgi:hypothetical protein
MNYIPTAEEFTKILLTEIANCRGVRVQSAVVEEKFIEFAKLHVEAALKAASEKARICKMCDYNNEMYMYIQSSDSSDFTISKDTIINAYPLDLIK